jgi:hypothetical protein
MRAVGQRVGAIISSEEKKTYFLGYGVYEGDFPFGDTSSTAPVGNVADMARMRGLPNPRIRLDTGQIVWGCECWWGPEEKIKEKLAASGKEICLVDIDNIRSEWASSNKTDG